MSIYTYLDRLKSEATILIESRMISMFARKPKVYRVVLDAEVGGYSFMLTLGCSDLDECIKWVNKNKDKGDKIYDIQEVCS